MKFDTRKLWNKIKWKRNNTDVHALFVERAKTFTKDTAKILTNMEGALDGIHEYMGLKSAFEQGAKLEWREITLIENADTKQSVILMIGVLVYPPGSAVELQTGEKVEVSTNTTDYFTKLVRVGLPLSYAKASKEQIVAYLKEIDEQNEKVFEAEKQLVAETLGGIRNDQAQAPVVKHNDTITTGEDFDLTQLTEEQRKNLVFSPK